jgi:hypothetical protein
MDFGIFTMVTNMGSCSPKANDYGTLFFFPPGLPNYPPLSLESVHGVTSFDFYNR